MTHLRWNDAHSACGRYMIQTAHIRGQGTEYRACASRSEDGGPPYDDGPIFDTKREAKAWAQADADRRAPSIMTNLHPNDPEPRKAYYVERVSRTVTTVLVYADSAEDAKRRSAMEGQKASSESEHRGFASVYRSPGEDRDA